MNLREWADLQGVHPQTAYRWFRAGTLPVPARQMGKLISSASSIVGELDTFVPRTGATAFTPESPLRTNVTTSIARSLG